MRFLDLGLSERVPGCAHDLAVRERLPKANAIKALFERLDTMLRATGYIAMADQNR
jgi:hypothetical protein